MARARKFACDARACPARWRRIPARLVNPKHPRCPSCGKPIDEVKPVKPFAGTIQAIPDIPEHFNVSLDCRVRGRTHLRQLQKERGCQDYEPRKYAQLGYLNGPGGERTRYRRNGRVSVGPR